MKISKWSRLLDLIAPRRCAVCGCKLAASEQVVCAHCYLSLPRTNYHLAPRDNPMAQLFWGLAPVERATAFLYYQPHGEVSQIIYGLKYQQHPDYGVVMGRNMALEIMSSGFFDDMDVVIPLPLARKRMRQRGYNQSEQLAKGICEVTHLSCNTDTVVRKSFHGSQTQLQRHERQKNVSDVFYTKHPQVLQGKHVLLVDDICTSGATMMACVEVLKEIPGIRISVLSLGFTKS